MNAGGVYKFGFPRSDMHVAVQGVQLKPALALGSWVAFKPMASGGTMVMGDLVLAEAEVATVMQALQDSGVTLTALHNHLLHENPHVMYMHIMAMGDAAKIARSIYAALARSETPLGMPVSPTAAGPVDLDTVGIARALGYSGKMNSGVYQVGVPRAEVIREHGEIVPPAMGVATSINFQPTDGGRAALTGDFVLLGTEVNPVIRALRSHGIVVTAVHSHMLTEEPRLFFMHFWANDNAVTLARGLRAALDATTARR
jgi:biotin operon repressor